MDQANTLKFDADHAEEFLAALGKNPKTTRVRAFYEKDDSRKNGDRGIKCDFSPERIQELINDGRGVYVVINEGGDTDRSITQGNALFCEWDDMPKERQKTEWKRLGLPEPTVQNDSGGRSIHNYWVFKEPIPPERFRSLQTRLAAHAASDSTLKNESRVMRLPGAFRGSADRSQHLGNAVRMISITNKKYDVEELDRCLLPLQRIDKEQEASRCQYRRRSVTEIREALSKVPSRVPGSGTYPMYRNLLWGLIKAVEEAGSTKAEAISLMQQHSPQWVDIQQVADSGGEKITAATFWYHVQNHGYEATSTSNKSHQRNTGGKQGHTQTGAAKKKTRKKHLSHHRRVRCFERCVRVQAKKERNSIRRTMRILKVAKDLEIHQFVNRPQISQMVLSAKDEQQGNCYKPLTADERIALDWPDIDWIIPGMIPANDTTIVGGRPKVGKTRFVMQIAAAVLLLKPFLKCSPPELSRPVIIITDDQGDADTKEALELLEIFDHPKLIWSRRFRLTETDIDGLLATIKVNPGAIVIIDSLRSISRSLPHGENDCEMGSVIYDLKSEITDAGGSLLLVHHCNKSVDLTGVEALSGHSAISGAANTVLTLHYLEKDRRLLKENPERRLVREARTGRGLDDVISHTTGTGAFHYVMSHEKWQENIKNAERDKERTKDEENILDFLDANPGNWYTCREIVQALGYTWGNKGNGKDASRIRTSLNKLHEQDDYVERVRAGTAWTYRIPRESEGGESEASEASGSSETSNTNAPEPRDETSETSETSKSSNDSEVSENGPRACDPHARSASEAPEVSEALNTAVQTSMLSIPVFEDSALGSGADVDAGDDDPHWGPRPV